MSQTNAVTYATNSISLSILKMPSCLASAPVIGGSIITEGCLKQKKSHISVSHIGIPNLEVTSAML